MTQTANPILEMADDGVPLVELKMGVVLYLRAPPGPAEAMRVYRHYLRRCGAAIACYRSTAQGSELRPWNDAERQCFENEHLPQLRQRRDWGYAFYDGRRTGSTLFMFHGRRPHTEQGKAGFYRFEFPWDSDPATVLAFTRELLELAPCLSGFAGYYFQGRSSSRHSPACDRMFALARRYACIEAHDLDTTADHMLAGYKCVNWLTVIGRQLADADDPALRAAREAAHAAFDGTHATLLQAAALPIFGDRDRGEAYDGYIALARALRPLQVDRHAPFGGERWTAENTLAYLRRFTDPEEFWNR